MSNYPAILGGQKTRLKNIPFRETIGDEEIEAVTKVLKSDVLSAFIGAPGEKFLGGKEVREFEKSWSKKYNYKHSICVNSWTSGLIIAIGAIGIEPGDEVICSPYTMSASATSVLFYGGIPIFADINEKTYNIDAETIERKITARTKAIMVVHIFGGSADMDPIMDLAKKYNLKVIEDAAQAPGIQYDNKPIGIIGDIGGFSFNFHKHIHTGEGGMLVTNDDELAFKSQLIRNHGENYAGKLDKKYLANIIGGNYRLTELQAAIGKIQLKKLDLLLEKRTELANYLHEQFNEIDCLETYYPSKKCGHSYYAFPIKYFEDRSGLPRSLFVKAVNAEFPNAEGWESVPLAEGYIELLYLNPIYQNKIAIGSKGFPFNYIKESNYDYSKGLCPVTEDMYYNKMIISPIVREPLDISDMKDLVTAIKKVLDNSELIYNEFKDKLDDEIVTPVSVASSKNVR